jgi:hypothetical protein
MTGTEAWVLGLALALAMATKVWEDALSPVATAALLVLSAFAVTAAALHVGGLGR